MKKILISDKLANEGVEILKNEKEFQVDVNTGLKQDELKEIIKDYDAIIIRSATKLKEDILEAADNLKFIGRAGVGLDNVDVALEAGSSTNVQVASKDAVITILDSSKVGSM